jgi:hypothetical protein
MNRRWFLQTAGTAGFATGLASTAAQAYIPEHNWEKYDWGAGPEVKGRLYQGPFPQYPPAAVVPDSDVVMVTTPSKEIVPNYGMGLVVYVSGDTGPPRLPGETLKSRSRSSVYGIREMGVPAKTNPDGSLTLERNLRA